MRLWEIFSRHIILLLLTWRCSRVIAGGSELIGEELDQVATDTVVRLLNTSANTSTLERPLRDAEITTILYENSNGFVPITPETQTLTTLDQTTFAGNYSLDRNFSSEHLSLFIRSPEYPKDQQALEDDPMYSTEARIFLSLTKPILTRRSSDSQDSSDEFELLKINDDTPNVANYDNFYNSFNRARQNARDREKEMDEDTESRFHEEQQSVQMDKNYYDDRSQGKKVEKYSTNYGDNVLAQNQRNVASGNRYFSNSQFHENQNENGYQDYNGGRSNFPNGETFDYNSQKDGKNTQDFRTTSQQDYNQRVLPDYQLGVQSQQKADPSMEINFQQRHPKPKSSQTLHRSRVNVKPVKAKSVSNVRSNFDGISQRGQNYNSNINQEQTPRYFEHEALFNREEGNKNYEKIEEAKELADDNYEYVEVTERPKRFRKQRKRIEDSNDSKRLPKEHRDFDEPLDTDESQKPKSRFRTRIRGHKVKGNSWSEHDGSAHDDDSEEGGFDAPAESNVNSRHRKQKFYNQDQKIKDNKWANVSPNLEISHSSGIEIDQSGKSKLLVPVKVNIVPLGNFDHATALGNSQGFDMSNAVLQNFVTATPITFNAPLTPITPVLSTPSSIFGQNVAKGLQNVQNQNLKVQSTVPEVIMGQNSLQNPMQTILLPQQNYQTAYKLGQNLRNQFLQNPNPSSTLQATNFHLVQQHVPSQSMQINSQIQNPTYNPNQNIAQNFQNIPQFSNPHPTPQTFENLQQNAAQSTYNVQVNPHGLQGHNLPTNQNLYVPQSNAVYSTTPMPNYFFNGNLESTDAQGKKNAMSGTNGQFLASASLTVAEQLQNQINAQNLRAEPQENLYEVFRPDNMSPRIKGFANTEATPIFYNFNGAGTQVLNKDHQAEQISQASSAIAQTYKEQNQQIMKVANEIFETTLKQLKQLQKNQNMRPNKLGFQNLQGLDNVNVGTKNVEIMNPISVRLNPVYQAFKNPLETSSNFGGLSLTTAFPIFATNFDASARAPFVSTIGPLSIQGYLDSLTEIGTKENDLKTSPTTNSKPNSPEHRPETSLYNPINFVPNHETLKSLKALNNKYSVHEPLPHGLNLVPAIPGGNFHKYSPLAQDDLTSKPKLHSDLQKYAEEMFKESLKTIYNSQKWNNDHKAQGSEISSVTSSTKLRDDLHNVKFSVPDIKPSKQILEAHFTDNAGKASGHASKPSDELKKPPSQIPAELSDMLKSDFKLPTPISVEPVRFYYKPNIHLNRPAIADTNHPDFKFNPDAGAMDYIHDFLTPPKPNAYVSKIPFNEPVPKRRPGPKRPTSDNGNGKFRGRLENGRPRPPPPPGVVETAAASNIVQQSFNFDEPRYEFLQSKPSFDQDMPDFENDYQSSYSGTRGYDFHSRYPSLTTSSPQLADDYQKPNFHHYDFNHPRIHNLMGLLRKNKRLPAGNKQTFFGNKEDLARQFRDDKQLETNRSLKESPNGTGISKKSDVQKFETNTNSTHTLKSQT